MSTHLQKILAVTRKECRHILRDYRSLYLAFILPLVLIMLFGYALSLDVENIEIAVVDLDRTPESRNFIRRLDASHYFHVKSWAQKTDDAIRSLDRGEAALAIIVPPGWSSHLRADRSAELQVIIDGSDPNFGSIARGYIEAFVERVNNERMQAYLNKRGEKVDIPVEARMRIWFNEEMESKNLIIPGIIGIIIMIVGAMLTCLVIAREFENGTIETIKSLPVNAWVFIIGKAIPYFVIVFVDIVVAVFLSRILFGIVMKGNPWLFLAAAVLYIGVAINLGLFISTITKSQLVANQMAPIVTFLPSILLSDYIFPQVNMPVILGYVTYVVPATYFIHCLKGVFMKNLGLSYLWPDLVVLFCMGTALALVNVKLLKKEGL
ncbi:MAG: ABC transporter permease [Syntrophales bacterium]|nr:ABC transporter permease [Syntrophales bacterium]